MTISGTGCRKTPPSVTAGLSATCCLLLLFLARHEQVSFVPNIRGSTCTTGELGHQSSLCAASLANHQSRKTDSKPNITWVEQFKANLFFSLSLFLLFNITNITQLQNMSVHLFQQWITGIRQNCWKLLILSFYVVLFQRFWQNVFEKIQTDQRFKITLFIRTKHKMLIFGVIPFIKLQNDT